MGVFKESWCFCKGVSKSEKTKAAILSGKGYAMAVISRNGASGTGFFIHRNLLLTAHVNIPSVSAAESCEILLHNGFAASLVPHRFFITSSVLDLTIVGLDATEEDLSSQGQQLCHLKTCSKPSLDLGSVVYIIGYTEKEELAVGEGKVVITTDNLIKLSTGGIQWGPGSAGFDVQGNLAFMICDPMKLAKSPNTRTSSSSSSSSSTSWKKHFPMQFGVPIPIIRHWLNQHWEGNLDALTKPKLPIIRLMSTGQKSERSSASFTLRPVFKAPEADNNGTPPSSNSISKTEDQNGRGCHGVVYIAEEKIPAGDPRATHVQGILTPEIYESRKLTAAPIRKKEISQIQLLDINFPPNATETTVQTSLDNQPLPNSSENCLKGEDLMNLLNEDQIKDGEIVGPEVEADIASTGSVNGDQSGVQSSSLVDVPGMYNVYSSEGETTMYSAETAESRNYPSPKEGRFQHVGRSQSCASDNRWEARVGRKWVSPRTKLEKQRRLIQGRKLHWQGETSEWSNDYLSPTVSSRLKKRNNLKPQNKWKPCDIHSSPRWML